MMLSFRLSPFLFVLFLIAAYLCVVIFFQDENVESPSEIAPSSSTSSPSTTPLRTSTSPTVTTTKQPIIIPNNSNSLTTTSSPTTQPTGSPAPSPSPSQFPSTGSPMDTDFPSRTPTTSPVTSTVDSSNKTTTVPPLVEWQTTTGNNNDDVGIDLKPLLTYVNDSAGVPGPTYFPNQNDNLYLIFKNNNEDDEQPLYSYRISMNTYWKQPVGFRRRELTNGLDFLTSTFERYLTNIITNNNNTTSKKWSKLISEFDKLNTEGRNGSIPILINWERANNCTKSNAKFYCCDRPYDASGTIPLTGKVPVMRFVTSWDCNYRLLIPTGDVLNLAPKEERRQGPKYITTNVQEEWTKRFQEQEEQYPWNEKINKVVHHGSIAILEDKEEEQNVEKLFNNDDNQQLFENLEYSEEDEDFYDLREMQNYTAVLDIHTLKYPQLLCQNSVVLKWDPPKCLDALWLETELEPWKHYIPIYNATHLEQMAQYVTSPENQGTIQKIMHNAHSWCRENIIYSKLQDILLETISQYVELLNKHDANWQSYYQDNMDEYFAGHFFRVRSNAYSIPKHIVGAIKEGLRRDDPNYNITSMELIVNDNDP